MTLTDPQPGFQGHDFFKVEFLKKWYVLQAKLL